MNNRVFAVWAGLENAALLSKLTGVPKSCGGGIDLVNEGTGIEVKSRLKEWYPRWVVHNY